MMHLSKTPREEDMKRINRLCESLITDINVLEVVQQSISGIPMSTNTLKHMDDTSEFSDLDDNAELTPPEASPAPSATAPTPAPMELMTAIHSRKLAMPSSCDGFSPMHCTIELMLRT
jgi:hypothetical protein